MQVTQDEKNLAMIAHGLVALTGLSSVLAVLGPIGWLASIATVVLYFVWKPKGPFVVRHAKQAAGIQVGLFILGIILAMLISGVAVTTVATGNVGVLALGGLFGLLALAVGILVTVLAVMGLLKAQKGEEFTYPLIGKWVDGLKI